MFYKDLLRKLIPINLGGDHELDLLVEGLQLDQAAAQITVLNGEIFPDTPGEFLADWERIYGLTPTVGATTESRVAALLGKYQETGDIKRPYFEALAAAMGYTIRIDTYTESQDGWLCAGDELLEEPWIYFTAGISGAGEDLAYEEPCLPWIWEVVVLAVPAILPSPTLEEVLDDLRPPHYQLNYTYLMEA